MNISFLAAVIAALLLKNSTGFTFLKQPFHSHQKSLTHYDTTTSNQQQQLNSETATKTATAATTTTRRENRVRSTTGRCFSDSMLLFMGRAAAVRASTKSKTDARKAKINAVFGKKLIMAVKQGGSSDPNANRALGDLIKQAKANSVPVDNINRAIKKATESQTGDFSESTFEAYGFGGASMIINVLSDNPNRSTADVKSTVNKRQGKIAEQGSVLFMYDRRGKVEVPAILDEEELIMAAIDAGCDDMELLEGEEEGTSVVLTDPKDTANMLDAVKTLGFEEGVKIGLSWISKAPVEVSEDDFEKNMQIIDALEDLDDVDSVEHNMSN